MKAVAGKRYWVRVGWRGWRARRLKCVVGCEGDKFGVFRGWLFNRAIHSSRILGQA